MLPPLQSSVKQSIHIWIAVFLLLTVALIFLVNKTTAQAYEQLVPHHTKWLDVFFTWFTYLGDGIFILLVAVVFLVRKYKWQGIAIIVSYAVSGVVAQTLKFFFPSPRPAVFYRNLGLPFYEIPGVTLMHSTASFPSGHTASAFALMGILVLLWPSSKWNGLWCILAVAVGYSRIYLGNHFLVDVVAGAAIGIITACTTVFVINRFLNKQ